MKKKTRSVAEAINPETGQPDLIGALRHVITTLNQSEDVERKSLYHILSGSMRARLEVIGIPDTYIADFSLVMQELGLARHRGGKWIVWEIVDITFFDEIVTQVWVDKAIHTIAQRHDSSKELRVLREKVEQAEKPDLSHAGDSPEFIEPMAEMVAEVERLNSVVTEQGETIVRLETELSNRPDNSPAAVAAALIERFQKAKAS